MSGSLSAVARLEMPFSLRIIGEGPEAGRLQRRDRAARPHRRVTLCGGRTHADLPHEYAAADIVIVPSVLDRTGDRDGLPNVVLEAMASARPVVATRIGAIPTAVEHQRTGWLVSAGDPAALAERDTGARRRRRSARAARAGGTRARRAGLCAAALHRAAAACPRGGLCLSLATLGSARSIGYVLKGFPRLSELFIASEIRRLERLGVPLRVYVIKRSDESIRHAIVDEIEAQPEFLPAAGSVSAIPLWRWLARHFGAFAPSLRRVLRRRPSGVMRAAALAAIQAIRARRGLRPRKVYVKEFLQAAALADRLLDARDVTHLHAHFCHGATTVTWLASVMTGLPFSFTAHAKDLYCASLNPAGLLRRKLAAASFVVTCTDANRQHLQRLANGTPVHCVYHGLNAELARLLHTQTGHRLPRDGVLRVLGVGRLVRKKGFDVLVEALALLGRPRHSLVRA